MIPRGADHRAAVSPRLGDMSIATSPHHRSAVRSGGMGARINQVSSFRPSERRGVEN